MVVVVVGVRCIAMGIAMSMGMGMAGRASPWPSQLTTRGDISAVAVCPRAAFVCACAFALEGFPRGKVWLKCGVELYGGKIWQNCVFVFFCDELIL